MNAARLLILGVGVIASVVVFLLMRFPDFRRAQYRDRPPVSFWTTTLSAIVLFAVFVLFALVQP